MFEIPKYDHVTTLLKSPSKLSLVLRIKFKGLTWLESTGSTCLSRLTACMSPIPHYVSLLLDNSENAKLSRKQAKLYQSPLDILG